MQGCGNVTTCAASSEDSISYNKTPIIIGELYLKFSLNAYIFALLLPTAS